MPNKRFRRNVLIAVALGTLALFLIAVGYGNWNSCGAPLCGVFDPGGKPSPTVVFPTGTATPTARPTPATPQPSPTPIPAPTQAPIPRQLIWSPEAVAVYLRAAPGGKVLRLLANGDSVLVSESQTVGGLAWAHILYFDGFEDVEGWVAAHLIVTIPGNAPLALVSGSEGAYLRAEPWGTVRAFLPQGTPLQVGESAESEGLAWVSVTLPDGRIGWVARHLLTSMLR